MEDKLKHLEFVQNVISRMNSNSFKLKELAITVISAFIALYANSGNATYLMCAVVPTIIFWSLDAFYLNQERQYRKLYQDIVEDKGVSKFSMDASKYECCYCKTFWSKTIAGLYCTISILLFLLGLFLRFKDCITINC